MKQIFFSIKLEPADTRLFEKHMAAGLIDGYIVRNERGRFKIADNVCCGYVQTAKNGKFYAFTNKEKYLLTNDVMVNVLHGDQILLKVTDHNLLKAEYLTMLKHKSSKIRGTVMDSGEFAFLIPDDNKKYPSDVFISKKDSGIPIEQYDRVIIQINEFDIQGRPRGKVLYKLQNSDLVEDPLQMIVEKYGIEHDFSSDVKKKAASLKKGRSRSNYLRRVDLTDEPIFTIDGIGAKDLDDAISIKKFGGNYELGVYIADVSNYVEEGSVLDKTAYNRGTSYYFVDKVIPMLPVELSNGICSLTPGEDRLCVGVKILFDKNGGILNREFFECIINSKKQFSYEEINDWLAGENEKFQYENLELSEYLEYGLALSKILFNKRKNRHAMMFEFDSMDFELDVDGGVERVFAHNRGPANKMIEEFMIAANESVATLFSELNFPFLFRIHDTPFSERVDTFLKICNAYGIDTSDTTEDNFNNARLNEILSKIEDDKLKKGLSMNLITTMKQAKYSPNNIGHFGLASEKYCHFTSPIRRYPDLYNHRLVKRYIRRTLNNESLREYISKSIDSVASHCCYTERNASKAEDEYDKVKALEYFLDNSSNEYKALIYSVSSRGLYILVDDCIPGFIRVKDIEYDEESFLGRILGKEYKIGDCIHVYFSEFDAKDKRLLFGIAEGDDVNEG